MITVSSSFKNKQKSKNVILFFSGFPGLYTKNEDLAEIMASKFNIDCLVMQLSGLGSDLSKFSLCKSIKEAANYAKNLIINKQYESYSLFGHSWGGLVCLNMLRINSEIKPEKIILLSPLTSLPEKESLIDIISKYSEIRTAIGSDFDKKYLLAELDTFIKDFNPINFLNILKPDSNRIGIIQANNDTVIDPISNREFSKVLNIKNYFEFEDSHWFSNRENTLLNFIKIYKNSDV